jgi:hypothetical protein
MAYIQSQDTVTLKFLKTHQEATTELIFIYLILYKIALLHKTRNKTFIIPTVNDMFIHLSTVHQQISNFLTKYQFETVIICCNWNEKCKT